MDTTLASLLCADANTELESTGNRNVKDYMTAAKSPLDEYADADTMRDTLRRHLKSTDRIKEYADGTADIRDHLLAITMDYEVKSTSETNRAIHRDFVTTANEVHKCELRKRRGVIRNDRV